MEIMKTQSWLKLGLVLVAGSMAVTGCVVRETRYHPARAVVVEQPVGAEIVVQEAPPAPIVETISVCPGPAFLWVPGAWVWEGRWVWARGHWARHPRAHAVWVPHRYEYRNGAHVFIRGGWR